MSADIVADFCVTGFGQFCGVPENPTTSLMRDLPSFLAADLAAHRICLSSCTVLETSRHCIPTLLALQHSSNTSAASSASASASSVAATTETAAAPPAHRTIFLHLGVASSSQQFALEDRAYNDADFRVPDESGWQPRCEPIDGTIADTAFHHRTRFDLARLCDSLRAKQHAVRVSHSAGRFICNYV